MKKKPLNCWEHHGCGREPGGARAEEMGVCPAAVEKKMDGIHRGDNAGRSCWIIAGTFCNGKVQGDYAAKMASCTFCEFFNLVLQEEHTDLHEATHLLQALNTVSRE